ncbi:hypothetical protein R1sor_004270 [Riccia sorocarpa]|uniref:Peptidase A2 domain-containing protein n=1 Tax=Riccia sorocarpa TaxID=122646 RepID=A0ABD3H4B1_9MARC
MDVNRVPEDEMVRSFELAVTPELREHVKVLIAVSRNNWEQFSRAMREQYFVEDADRVTKRSFLEWVEQPNKGLSATALLREFDTRYSLLTRMERMVLEDTKTELFLRAADPELQERLEMRLEDNEAEGGLTTNWRKVQDAVELLEKQEQRKERGVIRRFVPTAPAAVPIVPIAQIPVVSTVGQPARPLVPRKDDPSLEDIMKGMRDLSLKLTKLEEKGSGDAAAKPAARQGWVQRCIWCDNPDHARRECGEFSTMLGRGIIFWKDGKVALRDIGEFLATNFGKGGMKKLVKDYLAAHSVAAVEAACYGLSVGEDFTSEGYVKPSCLWKSALTAMKEEKTPVEVLARTATTIRQETDWNDPVETLAIHAYIAKSQHEALVEEKRQIKFSLRQVLGIAKKEFHDIIIDIVKRKRHLIEEATEGLTHALGIDGEDVGIAKYCQQTAERKKGLRVRFEDEIEEEGDVNPSHYTRDHWARATGETMVKLEGLEEPVVALIDHGSEINLMSKSVYEKRKWPIDTDHTWRIKAANNTTGGLIGTCPEVKLKIRNVKID